MAREDLEKRIREIGAEIHAATKGEVPSLFDRRRWMGKLVEWAMRDESFKYDLFRYIDVLPSLGTDELTVRLLREYFGGKKAVAPLMRWAVKRASKSPFPHVTGKVIRAAVESLARQFIAGRGPEDAMDPLESLWRSGVAPSVDLLGEVVVSDREAGEYSERYRDLVDVLVPEVLSWRENPLLERDGKGPIPRLDISLKISSFYSQIDPIDWEGSIEGTKKGLRPVFEKAREMNASICFDMEHYYLKNLTIAIFKALAEEFGDSPHVGIVLQSYLKDTRKDLIDLIGWAREKRRRISIRLVKGAYWDYEVVINRQRGWPLPVFLDKEETDLHFEELTEMLLENAEFLRPAVATHNIRSISHAIATAESLRLPKEAFEFQMLYGMGIPMREALVSMGYRVRAYVPVGELIPGMAYLVRRLLENTSNESFLRRLFEEKRPLDELIGPPRPERKVEPVESRNNEFRNEPPLDFSLASNRAKMGDALAAARRDFGRRYDLFVGGEKMTTGKEILSLNPANPGEVIGRVSSASRREAERALEEAAKASETWRETPPKERAQYLFRAAQVMRERRFELAALEVCEAGKTWKDADGDVIEAIDYLEYYGREMVRLGSPRPLGDYPGEENEYLYEPRGIGVVISPWNFPLAIPTGMVSAAIVAGNPVIFKPSGLSPVTGSKLVDFFRTAGLPPGVLQFLPGPGEEVGEFLISHPTVDFIAFTGSRDVGLRIVRLAGDTHPGQRSVKRVVAEMGGKNAIIVDETADLDEAVKGILESALGYQGQKCSACSRVIVVGDVFERLCERMKEAMESVRIGSPESPATFTGPLISEEALRKVQGYIEIGQKEGKVILKRDASGEGYFIGPVIVTNIDPVSPVAQEEIFGPVIAIIRAASIAEAIEIANGTPYALTGGIFSRSPANIGRAKSEFRTGNLYINRKITGALVGRQPFGGFGMSGVGSKAGGPDYLLQFMNPKSIGENTMRRGFAPLAKKGST